MPKIQMQIECPSCKSTGIYKGIGEGKGTGVVCSMCNGSGAYTYKYSYKPFISRKKRNDIKRVYLSGYGYGIGLGKIKYSNIGEIDMDKKGVSYNDFFNHERYPQHIKEMACPMLADQGACHDKKGFVNMCHQLNGGYINVISKCKKTNKEECWVRFEKGD